MLSNYDLIFQHHMRNIIKQMFNARFLINTAKLAKYKVLQKIKVWIESKQQVECWSEVIVKNAVMCS